MRQIKRLFTTALAVVGIIIFGVGCNVVAWPILQEWLGGAAVVAVLVWWLVMGILVKAACDIADSPNTGNW